MNVVLFPVQVFKTCLSLQKFESLSKRQEFEQRGEKSLDKLYKYFVEIPYHRIIATEFYLNHIPFENYFLKGFVDRIEQNSDGTFELYDYKTGSAKPKTQIADGKDYEGYLNQLRFYKLAFEIINPNAVVSKTGIIFVEEPEKNYYINLTDEDADIIESEYNGIEKILRLQFNDSDKDDGITHNDAKAIAEFVKNESIYERIIVHCGAGRSRSAGARTVRPARSSARRPDRRSRPPLRRRLRGTCPCRRPPAARCPPPTRAGR